MRAKLVPPNPKSPDFDVPDSFTENNKGENFLIYDEIHAKLGGRLMIFSTKALIEMLCGCEVIMVDGTFKTRPMMFSQVYVNMGKYLQEGTFIFLNFCAMLIFTDVCLIYK